MKQMFLVIKLKTLRFVRLADVILDMYCYGNKNCTM